MPSMSSAIAPVSAAPDAPARIPAVLFVLAMGALMWVAEALDWVAGGRLDALGIEPRDTDGLTGVVAAPFLHGNVAHLMANTAPFLLFGLVIAVGGLVRVLAVTGIVALVSGLGTWLVAPPDTLHIGASGIVFGYASYLLARGAFNRDLAHLAIGVVVAVAWGGVLLSGLVPEEGVSWQAHLFGAVGGVLAAWLLSASYRAAKLQRRAAGAGRA